MGVKRNIKRSASADKICLSEAFEDFIQEKNARSLSESTTRNYRQSFEFFCKYLGLDENTLVEEINERSIFKFIYSLNNRGVQPSSINHYLRDIRTFFYWCMESGREYISPPFRIKERARQEEPIKLFTDEEISALLEKPRKSDDFTTWRTWAIVNWVLATGNRAATICSITLQDISYAQKEITLRHTKNKKSQIIPLSSALETCLKEYIRMWRKEAQPTEWLFPSVSEEQLTTSALRQSFSRYCKNREVKNTSIHGLRHNFAKQFVRNNGNMFTLQKILGHSSLAMTRRYVKLFSEDIKEDYDRFSPLDTIRRSAKRTKTIIRNED